MESYAAGETTPALIEETIGANFARIAREHAGREALVEVATGRRWTYAELDRDVDALARGLLGAGVAKGDRVGIWSPNCAEWTIVQYATAKIGAILVNVNPAYRTHELAYALNQSGLRLLVSATEFKSSDYRAMVDEVATTAGRWSGWCSSAPRTGTTSSPRATPCRRVPWRSGCRPWTTATRSTSSTPREPPATPRARPCRTATSSTTGSSPPRRSASPTRTGSASRCPSTTASAW